MAKQVGPIYLERTIDNLIFYKMDGEYYVRMVPSFPDIKRSPRFRGTMRSARRMGRASKIGAALYAALPEGLKQFDKYRALTGEAFHLLKQGRTDEEALEILWLRQKDLIERGCAIASAVYEGLGISFRQPWMLWAFAEEAIEMIKAGKTDKEVLAVLWKTYAAEFETGYSEEAAFIYKNEQRLNVFFIQHLTTVPVLSPVLVLPGGSMTEERCRAGPAGHGNARQRGQRRILAPA